MFIPGLNPAKRTKRSCVVGSVPPAPSPGFLLISEDGAVGEKLRQAADRTGRGVLQTNGLAEALGLVRVGHLAVVVLDLDLPEQRAWGIAERLLQETGCPPLVLLTGRREQFDVSTAIRAGTLIDKAVDGGTLMEAVEKAASLPEVNRGERNAIQRIMIQWLRPCAWSAPLTPAYRFWGLNE